MTITSAQLRADLEALYESVHVGWTCLGSKRQGLSNLYYGQAAMTAATPQAMTHGCLFHQMYALTEPGLILIDDTVLPTHYGRDRREAMILALGFNGLSALGLWNDVRTRTWQEVKDRVKDAIGRL